VTNEAWASAVLSHGRSSDTVVGVLQNPLARAVGDQGTLVVSVTAKTGGAREGKIRLFDGSMRYSA